MLLHIIRKAANLCMLLCCMYAVWDADDIGRRDIRRFIYAGHNEQNHNRRQYTCTMSNAHTVLCGGGAVTTSSFYNGAMADDDDELHHIQYNNNMNANCSQLFGYIVWRHSAPQLDGWTHIKHAHTQRILRMRNVIDSCFSLQMTICQSNMANGGNFVSKSRH